MYEQHLSNDRVEACRRQFQLLEVASSDLDDGTGQMLDPVGLEIDRHDASVGAHVLGEPPRDVAATGADLERTGSGTQATGLKRLDRGGPVIAEQQIHPPPLDFVGVSREHIRAHAVAALVVNRCSIAIAVSSAEGMLRIS